LIAAISQGGLDFRLAQTTGFFAGRQACFLIASVSYPKSKGCPQARRQRIAGGLVSPGFFDLMVLSAGFLLGIFFNR
jgi:hypothetical protein